MSMTKDQIAAACERAKANRRNPHAERGGFMYDAGVRAATEYWLARMKDAMSSAIQEKRDTGMDCYEDEAWKVHLAMKEALGNE